MNKEILDKITHPTADDYVTNNWELAQLLSDLTERIEKLGGKDTYGKKLQKLYKHQLLDKDRDGSVAVEWKEQKEEKKLKTKEDIRYELSLIRDRDDCPENIMELIDEIRYSDFFEAK